LNYVCKRNMSQVQHTGVSQFRDLVGLKFQLYNSLFTSLPFHRIEKTGMLLSLLLNECEEGYKNGKSPGQILDNFFDRSTHCRTAQEKTDLLFRIVQYVERQVVLFDALEDAAYRYVNDMAGPGSLKQLESEVLSKNVINALQEKLDHFSIRLVLTAHPTQFYPGSVLGIINDLARALSENNTHQINMFLQQLGKTPFLKKQKPTPFDEAISLIWYLENVFYFAAGKIIHFLRSHFSELHLDQPLLEMGFWPGGDRDGNPHVKAETTLRVADSLRSSVIKCYYMEVRRMKRRLTFAGVEVILSDLEKQLYDNIFIPGLRTPLTREDILKPLDQIRQIIVQEHNGLFLSLVDGLMNKVKLFGLHFASLDIRQDSSIHRQLRKNLEEGKLIEDEIQKDTIESMKAIRHIQEMNGEAGCHRYIISHCTSVADVMHVYQLFLHSGWKAGELHVDIVPLFETIEDLANAPMIMKDLYSNEQYRSHLAGRKNKQTIMVGFSDGTKDGGYLMANWSIYKAKEELTSISRLADVDVVFFDGRGGPPARGGGKTHRFYASMGNEISNKEIQLTIQGQTVSSNFGTIDAAQFNMEQLLNAGISNELFSSGQTTLDEEEKKLLAELSEESYKAYIELKEHPEFLHYLSTVSPLNFYSETNIGSRPAKRGGSRKLELSDLRAIPFVGAWSQIKQNVTGFYGVGMAFRKFEQQGKFADVKKLYGSSLFFRTLLDNCEMALMKCYFPLTAHLAKDPTFGEIWNMIHEEFELTKKYILKLNGHSELMANYPVEQLSIQMRERIVLPLLTIQQYAITKLEEQEHQQVDTDHEVLSKLIIRSSFGIINAGRNSA